MEERKFYAETYNASVPDWPGEIDFYREMAIQAHENGGSVLELACGTGRVAIRLARLGVRLVGLDLSSEMLAVAARNSAGMAILRWVQGDMRHFDLGERFGLVIIPGHAFQNLLTSEDQVACMDSIHRHLNHGGKLVVHLDHQGLAWLGALCGERGGVFESAEEFQHPESEMLVRTWRAWSYEPATQTAIAETRWQLIGEEGELIERHETGPVRLYCVFRFEMEHLLRRSGFEVEALYGDFKHQPLQDDSPEMVWVAGVR